MDELPNDFGCDWWDDIFPHNPHAKPPGTHVMLRLIAYDISQRRGMQRRFLSV